MQGKEPAPAEGALALGPSPDTELVRMALVPQDVSEYFKGTPQRRVRMESVHRGVHSFSATGESGGAERWGEVE